MARKEVEVLNVSFLDVFACAIGAVTFITIIVFLNSIGIKASREGRTEPDASAAADLAAARQELGVLESEIAERRSSAGDLEKQIAARAADSESLREAAAQSKKASDELADAESRRAALRSALDGEGTASAELKARVDALQGEARTTGEAGGVVTFRIPLVRTVDKEVGAHFECADSRVFDVTSDNYTMTEFILTVGNLDSYNKWIGSVKGRTPSEAEEERLERSLISDRKSGWKRMEDLRWTFEAAGFNENSISFNGIGVRRLGIRARFDRKEAARGEAPSALGQATSGLRTTLAACDPSKQIVAFWIRPSGFPAFRAARKGLEELGYELTWYYYAEDQVIRMYRGSGGGSGGSSVK